MKIDVGPLKRLGRPRLSRLCSGVIFMPVIIGLCATLSSCVHVQGVSGAAQGSEQKVSEFQLAVQSGLRSFGDYSVNVKTYGDRDKDLSTYKTFDFDYTSKKNPLLEKELFKIVEQRLVAQGLTRSEDNPQLLITMNYYVGKKEDYVPPQTITTTRIQDVWSTGMIGFTPFGHNTPVPVTESKTVAGHTKVKYYRNIRLTFLDYKRLKNNPTTDVPPMVWMGEVESEGSHSDIRLVAPVMLGELIWAFPKSETATQRTIREVDYGTIGLSLDRDNWQIVAAVEPSSLADKKGIKPGDVIYEIDGFPMKQKRSEVKYGKYITNMYYVGVVSNTEGAKQTMVIKSPGHKNKKRTITITPRPQKAYVYVPSMTRVPWQ